jgi:hypothetical protein
MKIAEFIRETVLLPRLKQAGCMVVYDADQRYREACFELGTPTIRVIDAAASGIESREAAMRAFRDVGRPKGGVEGLLIYVPTRRPETDEQKQLDPFAVYATCGSVFPQDDGDEYLSLCLRAKPDHATEIRKLFTATPAGPSFAVIDAVGGGVNWPQLRATLQVESSRELLQALLVPSTRQLDALKAGDAWLQEAHDFLLATLGMTVKTRVKTWAALADELWRYILFSEFAFDLPVELPAALKGVPHAPAEAKPIVEDVCDRMRRDDKARQAYISRAEAVEQELNLAEMCGAIEDLGARDTFPFEERSFLRTAIKGIATGDPDLTRRVLSRHQGSLWQTRGESMAQWELVRAGLSLIEACDDHERQLPDHARSQEALLDFYLGSLREVDRLQREFEQAAGDVSDPHGLMDEVLTQARAHYGGLAAKVQGVFVKHLEATGWPPTGRMANVDVFDRLVAERLKDSGRRVAYVMVDALRYELGVALEKMLADEGPVELHAACAQLPSITPVGMASLLPGARAGLHLGLENDTLVPRLGELPVGNVAQRMGILAKRYGDRFAEMPLSEFIRAKAPPAASVDLLVLRSTEIDSQLENNPESTLRLIPTTLKQIRVALHKLRGLGFREAVIVTDHGFFLNAQAAAGDVCAKPQGQWPINAHDRMLLGVGASDSHSTVLGAEKLGIRGDFSQVALPRSMAPYRAGHLYFHGGASLAEAVVPVLVARLDTGTVEAQLKLKVNLKYKEGAKHVTTRLPVIAISVSADDLFTTIQNLEVLLEAHDGQGNVIGEARPGGEVDPARKTVMIGLGQTKQVVIRMEEDFRGKFELKALNPTTLAAYASLALETDYTE